MQCITTVKSQASQAQCSVSMLIRRDKFDWLTLLLTPTAGEGRVLLSSMLQNQAVMSAGKHRCITFHNDLHKVMTETDRQVLIDLILRHGVLSTASEEEGRDSHGDRLIN